MTGISYKGGSNLIASIKDMDIKKGIVTGYAASFNTLDADNDIILPGAFSKTLSEQGPKSVQPRIKHLLNHDINKPIGNPLSLQEDAVGLKYESQVGSHALGVDFLKMVDSGLITEHSIGFRTIRKEITNPDANWQDQVTHLKELRLMEFSSLTAWGANQYTPLTGVKSLQAADERIEKLLKAMENGTFKDSTFELLQQELLFLQQSIKNITTEPVKPTQPDYAAQIVEAFKIFNNQKN